MHASALITALHWRYATKVFDAEKVIPADTWQQLEHSLLLTPSSFGLQPWKFIVIQDKALRQSLVQHSWGQAQVADCSHLLAIAVKKNLSVADIDQFLASMVQVRGGTADALAGFRQMMVGAHDQGFMSTSWAKAQAYIALGQFMTACALLEIDACPMEGFVPEAYDQALGLEADGYTTAVLCPAGYRGAGDKYATLPKVRYSSQQLIQHI
jgi:nitroreductase